ncbi:lysoplasmalogenase [Maritimibacter sp. HL-12]|uniref:lysoplasmalogenase n=1 Tax=Maritimibacter sp. HL-12 TaxID=1162418 RepID=UPI000A0F184A|nr:lysoplasmalogenase [Maritimibacter sp. HL-12]SMH40248.1 Uncharacterized membrane protein YhhN [Maritimibacter sp. HL-12]
MTSHLAFWAGLALALAYLPWAATPATWPRSALKTVPLLALALAAGGVGAPPLLVAALLFSAAGDFALSRPGRAAFLYGLAAFALAHLVYVLVFSELSQRPPSEAFALSPLVASALVAFGLSAELWLVPHVGRLAWPVRIYVALIVAMGLAALTLPLGVLALGAGLFIASDTLLALRMFRMDAQDSRRRAASWAVWGLYIAGQALIAVAAAG